MRARLDLVSALSLDAFLLARFAAPGDGRPDGRAWERAVSQLLWRPGLTRRQHAGTRGLFGGSAASGVAHELDGVGVGSGSGVWIESKARATLEKSDIAVFKLKCEDFYRAEAQADPIGTALETWWPLFVSSEIVAQGLPRLCCATGIILCEPQRLPLPVLLRAAARPMADEYLREGLLAELVRLGERACRPMQEVWKIDPERGAICQSLDDLSAEEIGDLLYLQDELSDDLLDALELHAPGWIERRAEVLIDRLAGCALAT